MAKIFDLEYSFEDSQLVILPVPWEATTSFRKGTGQAPEKIIALSDQLDLMDRDNPNWWKNGISALDPIQFDNATNDINHDSKKALRKIQNRVGELISVGKKVGLIGGEHSITEASIAAHKEQYKNVSILQIDAHMDLRKAYQGLTHSHASVMRNITEFHPEIPLTQVAIRDYCEEEWRYQEATPQITTFLDHDLQSEKFNGKTWDQITSKIIETLTENIYITLDIDGLTPAHCPNTGTPVPGGLNSSEVIYLIQKLATQKTIIGFDLVEVSSKSKNDHLDAIIATHILKQVSAASLKTSR